MKITKEPKNLHIRVTYSQAESDLTPEKIQRRFVRLFALLLEIDQQPNVMKEYSDGK